MILILKILVLLCFIKPISEANEVARGLLRPVLGRLTPLVISLGKL